jgi:hypothetical protein
VWRLEWMGQTVSLVKFPTSVGMVPVQETSSPVPPNGGWEFDGADGFVLDACSSPPSRVISTCPQARYAGGALPATPAASSALRLSLLLPFPVASLPHHPPPAQLPLAQPPQLPQTALTPVHRSTRLCVPLTGRGCRQPVCAALGGTVAPTACTGWWVTAELEGADAAVGWWERVQ